VTSAIAFSVKAILFDLDGVLVDSTEAVERVWRKWAAERGLDPEHIAHIAHGRRSIETIRMVAPEMNAEAANDEVERLEIDDTEGVVALDGALDLLSSLPAGRWTVVTSGTRPLATTRLSVSGLPVPEKFISANDVEKGKPDPEPYTKGAALLSFDPHDCLVIEDTAAGIGAGKAAGCRVIALTTTFPPETLVAAGPDAITRSCGDLRVRLVEGLLRVEVPDPIGVALVR
jgi:sugar-phosphatase